MNKEGCVNKESCVNNECCTNNDCNRNSDLILSIALEQTALSHILNAEGEKIQKALELNCSIEDLLAINSSVANTIEDITHLEIVLYNKLKLYMQGCSCSNSCCCDTPCCDSQQLDASSCICKTDISGSITICTTDCKACVPLDDIEVSLYDKTKSLIASGTTKKGKLIKLGLCAGEYYIAAVNLVSGEKQSATATISARNLNIVKTFCFCRNVKKEGCTTC